MNADPHCHIDFNIDLESYDCHQDDIQKIADYTLSMLNATAQVSLNGVDEHTMHQLNLTYRQKDSATNVLTFVYPPHESHDHLVRDNTDFYYGEIFLCHDVLKNEAKDQEKILSDHTKHILIHALLHLCGCDHETTSEAEHMESIEIDILRHFNINNPYLS